MVSRGYGAVARPLQGCPPARTPPCRRVFRRSRLPCSAVSTALAVSSEVSARFERAAYGSPDRQRPLLGRRRCAGVRHTGSGGVVWLVENAVREAASGNESALPKTTARCTSISSGTSATRASLTWISSRAPALEMASGSTPAALAATAPTAARCTSGVQPTGQQRPTSGPVDADDPVRVSFRRRGGPSRSAAAVRLGSYSCSRLADHRDARRG